ncbi:MAG: gliding motility-associated C-terminal domain-containing protein [Flavipsychrobacter sp.]
MRKCLLFVALILVSQINVVLAQSLFVAPDTLCAKQPVKLMSNAQGVSSHYFGFCSGYIFHSPTGDKLKDAARYKMQRPGSTMEVIKEGNQYYGFMTTVDAANNEQDFLRFEFGTSLANNPVVTSFGNMDSVLLSSNNSIYIVKDGANWHIFLAGGTNVADSRIARIDFGKSLANDPNIVNFGNLGNMLNGATGIFVAKEGNKWHGFCVNKGTGTLLKLDMDTSISITPTVTSLGNVGGLSAPTDLNAVLDNGNWYFFVTNGGSNSVSRIDMGNTLTNATPAGNNLGNIGNLFSAPSGITFIRDCDSLVAFITNRGSNALVRMEMTDVMGPYTTTSYSSVSGNLQGPLSISTIVRDRDNLYTFVVNSDTSFARIKFEQCKNSSIEFSLSHRPPEYSYDQPGVYNIYYAVDEGLPTMKVECKLITVLPIPSIIISNDTTICQGDTVSLEASSVNAISHTWTPNREISSTSKDKIQVWPSFTTRYRVVMPFPKNCIVDTGITIKVHKVKADAGPDRQIIDGATTLLGGPENTLGPNYTYEWIPDQYISDRFSRNPVARPPFDFTYYFEVRDTSGCKDVDTVVIRVDCNDLNLPNAFIPETTGPRSKFGLVNQKIVKLNYLNVYDRWGQQVFTTTDPTKKWDGTINGEMAPMGVYVWEADAFCVSGKRIHKSGNVTLIR